VTWVPRVLLRQRAYLMGPWARRGFNMWASLPQQGLGGEVSWWRWSCPCHGWRLIRPDVDINTSDTSTPTHNHISGPITRARARQLNNQVSSFLASYSSYLDNGNVYSVLLFRSGGQEQNGVAFPLVTFEFQNSSSL
jgi:hypothetical protein